MASSTSLVDTLEKELECSICLNMYTNPKTLPCLHTFCCHCLDKLAEKSRENRQQIACPDCRTQIDLPQGTMFDIFPTAFFLNRLKDIVSVQRQENQVQCGSCDSKSKVVAFCLNCKCFICVECQDLHFKLKAWKGHRVTSVEQIQDVQEILRTPQLCQEEFHDNADLEYFCQTCQKCVCQKCTTVTHKNHELQHLKQAAEHAKSRLEETQTKVQERADVWREQMNKDNETHTKIKQQIKQTRQTIQENERRLIELVKQHTKELLTEVDKIEKNQETKFQQHTDNMGLHLAQLNSITEYLHSVLQRGICEEILGAEPAASSRAKEIFVSSTKCNGLKNVKFQPDEDVCRRIEQSPLGWVHVELANLIKTQIQGLKSKERIYKGHQSQFTVVTKDTDDNICYSASEHVSVQILSPAGSEVETEVEDRKDGTYTVCFTPNTEGVHHVTVRIRGQSTANSPLDVYVTKGRPTGYRAEATFGSHGSGKGQFKFPHGIAVNRAGEVAVTDSNNHRVQIFSTDGQYLREFGAIGNADAQLSFPAGLAYNKAGHIVVADQGNSRIQVFSSTGRWISTFGQDVLKRPCGVSVTSDDNLVVCDIQEETVNVFTQDEVLLLKFVPSPGNQPVYAIIFERWYYVSQLGGHVIKVFDSSGSYLYDIGEQGNGAGQFNSTRGLVVNMDDLLLVCNSGNRVEVMTLDGTFVTSFGSYGSGVGQFVFPQDIAVMSDGRVFVSDECNHRIQVFQPQY